MTRYEQARKVAEYHLAQSFWGDKTYTPQPDHVKRMQKQIFAKWIVNGATIGKKNGKLVVHKKRIVRKLP